jgi:hypothetical protein
MLRSTLIFGAVSLALVSAVGWVLALVWPEPAARHAILVSAVLALVVQLFAFAAARLAAPTNVLAGWGVGMLLRLVVLVGYGFVAPRAFGLPLAPALIALVAFFFVTSLVEPVLLKT